MSINLNILPDREAVVAGRFYPGNADELKAEINGYVEEVNKLTAFKVPDNEQIYALVVPHAGYIFSGTVAASAFRLLSDHSSVRRVFIIGSSHHALYEGASVYYSGHYNTPLGPVAVDTDVAEKLLAHEELFRYHREAHRQEHSLEVQLPFLQYFISEEFRIIPILVGSQNAPVANKLATVLGEFFGQPGNLFVISTDLSHYPEYNDALKVDKQTIESLCSNSPSLFEDYLESVGEKNIYNLATSMCGWTSALTLLHMTSGREGISYHPVLYQNSGDIPLYGDKSRVVGYQSVVVSGNHKGQEDDFSLTREQQSGLLDVARRAILDEINGVKHNGKNEDIYPEAFQQKNGAFVSLYVGDELRGCIGNITSEEPLFRTIQKMAVASATRDTRFAPIKRDEMNRLTIEISVLSPLLPVSSPDEIIPGKHGILIKKDFRSGTFLPQVARRTGWNAIKLLEECAERKAGLGKEGWKDAELFVYEAFIFSDKQA